MAPLSEESDMIADAVAKAPPGKYDTDETAGSWQARRVKNRRIANRKVSHLNKLPHTLLEIYWHRVPRLG